MEDLSKPLEISSIDPTKIFRFLTSINQADKILFILEKYGVIRHSEIKRINEMLPGITRKSTRTYYKNYKRLRDQRFIERIKEKTIEQQYYAYSITENGRKYLQKLLGIDKKGEKMNDLQNLGEEMNKNNSENKDEKEESRGFEKKKIQNTKAQEEFINKNENSPVEPSIITPAPLDNSIMLKLTNVLEKIDTRLDSLPISISQAFNQRNSETSEGVEDYDGYLGEDKSDSGDFDEEDSYETMDTSQIYKEKSEEIEETRINIEDSEENSQKTHIEYLKSKSNTEIINFIKKSPEDQSSKEFIRLIGERDNILEEKIRLYIRLKSIYIDNSEIRKELKEYLKIDDPLSKFITYLSNCTSDAEEEAIWEIIGPAADFDLSIKKEIFLKLVGARKIGYLYTKNLIRRLNLKAKDLNSIIEDEHTVLKISPSLEIILYDIMASQLIANKSIEWDTLLDFTVKGEPKSKKGFIVYYLERAFLIGIYGRVLKMIQNLKEQKQFTIDEAQIELLILLNLKKYDILEKRIKEYDIFSDEYQNYDYYEEMIFIAFRNYYEQAEQSHEYPGKLTEILKKDSPFTKKWQKWRQIARLERDLKRMRNDEDYIDIQDIQDILLKISPAYQQVYQFSPNKDLWKFYDESLLKDNMLFYFCPHFAKWLNSLGGNGPEKAVILLKKWWKNRNKVVQHLSLQEEVLSLLKELDSDNYRYWQEELEKLRKSRNIIIENTHIHE
ncbi:MAG: hypothetical protein ACTSWX_04965 [Promethearchaeota archaeon]